MSIAEITALVIALGSAPVILKIIDVRRANTTGKAREEKQRNRTAIGRVVFLEDALDNEASYRRIMQEYASQLRRLLIDWGYPEDKLPSWPVREKDTTK